MKNYVVRMHTMTDGNRTVAEASLLSADEYSPAITTGAGSAGREPGDKADKQVGEWLAMARVLRSVAAHLDRKANGRMRHLESNAAHRAEIAAMKALKILKEDAVQYNEYGLPAGITWVERVADRDYPEGGF